MEDNEKKSGVSRVEAFFAGKGFYIVLLLCVAVIGVSAWSMLSGGTKNNAAEELLPVSGPAEEETVATWSTTPPATAAPATPAPTPNETPSETAGAETAEVVEEPVTATISMPEDPVEVSGTGQNYFIWPVSGAVENGYSMTALVFDRTMQDWRTHDGLDIAADLGAQVRAVANGKVTNIYFDERLGTTVVMSHNGGLESIYANLAGTPAVAVGDQVGVGQVIGAVGDTALYEVGEVCHLHFAMTRDGVSVDPNEYLP